MSPMEPLIGSIGDICPEPERGFSSVAGSFFVGWKFTGGMLTAQVSNSSPGSVNRDTAIFFGRGCSLIQVV